MLRLLATQFSAATGLAVTDTGVVNDANPTSSDAILAQTQTLVLLAEQLNTGNAESLYHIAQMAQAIELGCTPDELPEEAINCMAHFKNPSHAEHFQPPPTPPPRLPPPAQLCQHRCVSGDDWL